MRTQRSSRRSLLRRAGILGTAFAVGATSRAEADSGRADRRGREQRPVGSWSVLVTIEGEPEVERAHYSFSSDGQLILQTTRHTHTGLGSWHPIKGGFVYATRGLRSDADGGFLNELRIRHTARFNPDGTFTSTGTGQAVDADGNVLMEVQSRAVGTRFGIDG
ncbi:hypothetical protein AB0K93_24635 [Streptomyces sp. NPDC052676]|uniref:hypothetical protein n=1 Tax=Streptomyces sp. NPDC052676 TaxID=3154953 RepID=UPI003433C8B8